MADYGFLDQSPETSPIFRRESEMKINLSGGYGFKADPWKVLGRWLLTGSMFDCFYQSKFEMTTQNTDVLKGLIADNPGRVGEEILYASKNGVSVHTPILAMVFLSTGDGQAKTVFTEIFSQVIRTGSHLYELFSYIRGLKLRGFGTVIHRAVIDWLGNKEVKELEYQFLKYQSRTGWSGRDVLRMIKPVPDSEDRSALYRWIVGKSGDIPEVLNRIRAYETLKKDVSESDVVEAIRTHNLTWEMIPGNIKLTGAIWEALFQRMPIGATIRNLGNLTEKGVFSVKNLDMLEEKFSGDNLRMSYIHPIVLASAYRVYMGAGTIGKSKLRWEPIPRVEDILEEAIEKSFQILEPTGHHFYHALDVSGSMTGGSVGTMWLAPFQVEGVMALASIRAEKNYFVGGFGDKFSPLDGFRKSAAFKDAMGYNSGLWPKNWVGTNAASAFEYATKNKIETDVFVMWTDNESWAGKQHSCTALAEYRKKVNPKAKAIYITLVPYGDGVTLADPKDPMSYDIAGFTAETPKLIQMIADGTLDAV